MFRKIFIILILFFSFQKILNVLVFAEHNHCSEMDALLLVFEEDRLVVAPAKYEQKIKEAPAIVTVINAEEIKQMGARNLMDILRTIPGFSIIQDTNEHLVAVRGVYASTNQKFLVLKDGHRLNEFMWNTAEPDYSLSLANVKRIEIIRDPGGSLYGSAALCAVINLITKDGCDINGFEISIGGGNFGQIKSDLVYGTYSEDLDLLIYSSYYENSGQKQSLNKNQDFSSKPIDGYEYVDKIDPSYDCGIKLVDKNVTFSASLRRSHYSNPRANSGQIIDWSKEQLVPYEQVFRWGHLDLEYRYPFSENYLLKLRHYWDYDYYFSWQLLKPAREYPPYGKFFFISIEGCDYGLEYSLSRPFCKGNLLIGIQPEGRAFWRSEASRNYDPITDTPTSIIRETEPPVKEGDEYYLAAYVQTDQKLTEKLSTNVGIRYDYYEDVGDSLNPRLALVSFPFSNICWKIIYNKAFLNPSYFYRYVTPNLLGYYGGPDLKPEIMESYQTEISNRFGKNVWLGVNFFYNTLTDLVAPDKSIPGRWTYKNYGEITVQGIETELRISICRPVNFFANHTYQEPVREKTDKSQMKDGAIINIPRNTANFGINWHPYEVLNCNLIANWHGKIESPQSTAPAECIYDDEYEIPSEVIFDFTIMLEEIFKNMETSLSIHNLFDKRYYMGGTTIPYSQQGRWILLKLGYKF